MAASVGLVVLIASMAEVLAAWRRCELDAASTPLAQDAYHSGYYGARAGGTTCAVSGSSLLVSAFGESAPDPRGPCPPPRLGPRERLAEAEGRGASGPHVNQPLLTEAHPRPRTLKTHFGFVSLCLSVLGARHLYERWLFFRPERFSNVTRAGCTHAPVINTGPDTNRGR